jgi:hypothetical protein
MAVGSSPVVDKAAAETTRRYRRLRALNVFVGVLLAAEALYMLLAPGLLVQRTGSLSLQPAQGRAVGYGM